MPNHQLADTFFTDAPLAHCADGWRAQRAARMAILECWADHTIVAINGHCVWKSRVDLRPEDWRVLYGGDYSDVLAPNDPRISIPREECADLAPRAPRLSWDE